MVLFTASHELEFVDNSIVHVNKISLLYIKPH